jgi:hypothetical protein
MTTVPGLAPTVWSFSVSDQKVASQLSQIAGKRLVLHHKEYRYISHVVLWGHRLL